MTNPPFPEHYTVNQNQGGLNNSGKQSVNFIQNNYPRTYANLAQTQTGAISFDPRSLREVIVMIAGAYDEIERNPTDFTLIKLEEKNKLNGLSEEFYQEYIAKDYEPFFNELDRFLTSHGNSDLHGKVGKISRSLGKRISANRGLFDTFENLLLEIEDALLDSQYSHLSDHQDMISLFLFYLYANCYIGKKTADEK